MELTVGAIVDGKVKSITNFGAFVSLGDNKTGMVHISEVSNSYVSDIRAFLTEGQDVKVMVLGVEGPKINLSIKRLEPKKEQERPAGNFRGAPRPTGPRPAAPRQAQAPTPPPAPKTADQLFEERLKAFMSESDTKLSSIRADHRTKSRRR